jgi:hypothetical protein
MMALKSAQDSPMDFYLVEFERIAEFVSVGDLKTHQTNRKKKIKTKPTL